MDLEHLIVRIEADSKPIQTALESVNRVASRTLGDVARWGDKITTSFVGAAVQGRGLSDVLRGIARDLASSTLRSTVINPIGDVLSGAIGSIFGRAGGGSVAASTPYMVGERGPELFVPHSAGRIEPAAGGAATPLSVSINIDARGAAPDTAQRLQAVASEIQTRTFEAVFAAMERGGRYARISGRR
jgi:hypothetical protein